MSTEETEEQAQVRISISMDAKTRRLIRIAAAYADMEVGEWAQQILRQEAEKVTGADRGGKS
jgi:uncharacterized protein (DUF1778 family)